jgi:hypothetical protein
MCTFAKGLLTTFKFKYEQNITASNLDDFAKKNNLAIEEDKEEKYLVISKP